MLKGKTVPFVGLMLALASSVGLLLLQQRQLENHAAQLKVAKVENQLNQLEGLPWYVENPRYGTPKSIHAQMVRSEQNILTDIASLQRSSPPDGLSRVVRPLKANFAVLEQIYAMGLQPSGWTRPGPTTKVSQAQATTSARTLQGLDSAGGVYARRVRIGGWINRIGGVGTIALLFAGFVFYYCRSERVARVLRGTLAARTKAHEELQETADALRHAQRERRRLLERTVAVAEHERIRVAMDLHDGPIQQLTALSFNLDRLERALENGDLDQARGLMENARGTLGREMAALRRLMVELRPPILDEGGLGAALRDAVETVLGAEPVKTTVACDLADYRLAAELETVVYRVVHEALVNIRKHAQATAATVTLEVVDNESVRLSIVDDGIGFDGDTPLGTWRGRRYGLLGMRERVEGMSGTWEMRSRPGAGTELVATLPLKIHDPDRPEFEPYEPELSVV